MYLSSADTPFVDVVNISDLHCGSVFGLWPPDFRMSDGGSYVLNKGQQWLYECWLDAASRLKKWCRIAAYVLVGDLVDGTQSRRAGMEAVTTRPQDQADAAEVLLRRFFDIAGKAPVFAVQGTEFHDAYSGSEVERIAKSLGAVRYEGRGTGYYCKEVLDLSVRGVVINYSHGIGVSGGLYRATAPDRESVWGAVAAGAGKSVNADVLVRAHAHYFIHVEHEERHVVVNPCWQLQTRYMRKHSPYRMMPSIGLTFVRIWTDGSHVGDSRVEVKKVLYKVPEGREGATVLEEVV